MYSTAHSRPSRSFSTSHSHLQSAKSLCLPHTAPSFIGEKKGGCTAALLPAADFRRQSTEAANLPLPGLAQRRFSGQGRGELRSEAALGAQLKQLGKAELYDLTRFALIYFSSSEKAVFNFANKSYRLWLRSLLQLCSVQRRVSLHQQTLAGSSVLGELQKSRPGALPPALPPPAAPPGKAPRGGKVDSQAAGEVLAVSTPRTRHCKRLLRPFKVTAGLLFVILAFPAPHIIPSPFLLATKQSCPIPRWPNTGNSGFFYTQQFKSTRFRTKWWFAKYINIVQNAIFTLLLVWSEMKNGKGHHKSMWRGLMYKRKMYAKNSLFFHIYNI